MSGDIFLNIDTIVLHGLGSIDRHALMAAVQQALVEQLASSPRLTALDRARVRTGINLPGGFGSEQLGEAVGYSVSKIITSSRGPLQPRAATSQGGQDHG